MKNAQLRHWMNAERHLLILGSFTLDSAKSLMLGIGAEHEADGVLNSKGEPDQAFFFSPGFVSSGFFGSGKLNLVTPGMGIGDGVKLSPHLRLSGARS